MKTVVIKKLIKQTKFYQKKLAKKYYAVNSKKNMASKTNRSYVKEKIYYQKRGDKLAQISDLLQDIKIDLKRENRFLSWIDVDVFCVNLNSMIENTSPNYELILKYSIEELKRANNDSSNKICKQNLSLLSEVERYIDRIIYTIQKEISSGECTLEEKLRLEKSCIHFNNMKSFPAKTLEEALQRIIFWSDLFWQTNHKLMGLGRLDYILRNYEVPKYEESIAIIQDFYEEMHRFYEFKSSTEAVGDTGQIIILGGTEADGSYFCNEYTYLFIDALIMHSLPDPKLLLRVSKNMPYELLEKAVKCIATGVGSPLLSNDDIVIGALEKFGYSHKDACNYVTSACWEPLAYGKSSEVNNIKSINYAKALVDTYKTDEFCKCLSFEDVIQLYFKQLNQYLDETLHLLEVIRWEKDPLLTLFTDGCMVKNKDIGDGGALYNNYGLLGDGWGNTVNSLLFIDKYVFKEQRYTLMQLKTMAENNYEGFIEDRLFILENCSFYGRNEEDVHNLINRIKDYVKQYLGTFQNDFGGKIKWGMSSSNYMKNGRITDATLDGRRSGEALNVHISSASDLPYTELLNFASKLDYEGHFSNGNVVDFMVAPSFINDNIEKFTHFVLLCIKSGFFQLQMNVIDSETLINAKNDPEKFKTLIVRVWGFSAYFVELSEDYQDLLIKRALMTEGKFCV